jgi:hypothetical protein
MDNEKIPKNAFYAFGDGPMSCKYHFYLFE